MNGEIKRNSVRSGNKIWLIDMMVVVVSLFVLIVVVGYSTPYVISSIEGEGLIDGDGALFSIPKTSRLLISEDGNFSSSNQYLLRDGLLIELGEGVYYFKIESEGISEIKSVSLRSKFVLKLVEGENSFYIVNGGDRVIDVMVYDLEGLVYEDRLGKKLNKNRFFGGLR
jgi:hypothetical protein